MIRKLTKLSTRVSGKQCLLAMTLFAACSLTLAAERLTAGADDEFRKQLFIERASSQDLASFSSDSGSFLGRLSLPADQAGFGLLMVVDQDRDLIQRNLETVLLNELGLSGWPVFIVSLGRTAQGSYQDESSQELYASILNSALREFEQRSIRQIVLLASEASLETGSQLAARSEVVSHLMYKINTRDKSGSAGLSVNSGISRLNALSDSRVGIVDLVPASMSKKMLASRKRALAKEQLADLHDFIYVPGFEQTSSHQVIAKRLRAWMKENRRGSDAT